MTAERALTGSWDRRRAAELDGLAAPAAAVPSVNAASALHCAFHAPESLPADIAMQWEVLADEASEPCVFAERWFLEPSLELLAESGDVRIAAVLSDDGLLVGLMPVTVKGHYGRVPVRNVQNWLHDNAFLGAPMVRKGMEVPFWAALLEALNDREWATGVLHISGLVENGPLHRALRATTRCDTVHRTERALLSSDLDPEAYWTNAVRKKKRKELGRLANRLEEQGCVSYATLGEFDDIAPWLDDFLALESKGWKGETGSALACDPRIEAFFRRACLGARRGGKLDFHRLDVDGRPIAMLVNFLSKPGAFEYKTAFDEEYRQFSPGVMLQRYNLRILDQPAIKWVDSCASQDHPMINSLWRERRQIVRVTVPLAGWRNSLIFNACRRAEDAYGTAKRKFADTKRADREPGS